MNLTATNGNRLLMGLAERADLIVDFTNVPVGNYVLGNVGPDEPFGGGEPGEPPEGDFDVRRPGDHGPDPAVPGRAGRGTRSDDTAAVPAAAGHHAAAGRGRGPGRWRSSRRRRWIRRRGQRGRGPVEALLGVVDGGVTVEKLWMDPVTENPAVGNTEVWEFYNTTADAHPMHIHEVAFEVVNREGLVLDEEGEVVQPVPWTATITRPSRGRPGSRTRSSPTPARSRGCRMHFTNPGQFVWHCHIVEHEDNEMMRPYRIEKPGTMPWATPTPGSAPRGAPQLALADRPPDPPGPSSPASWCR